MIAHILACVITQPWRLISLPQRVDLSVAMATVIFRLQRRREHRVSNPVGLSPQFTPQPFQRFWMPRAATRSGDPTQSQIAEHGRIKTVRGDVLRSVATWLKPGANERKVDNRDLDDGEVADGEAAGASVKPSAS